jgi:hypothetical protein
MQKRTLLSVILLFLFFAGFSQNNKHRAFAITGQAQANFNWTDIRSIQLNSGDVSEVIYESGITKFIFKNASTQRVIDKIILRGNPAFVMTANMKFSGRQMELLNPTPTFLKSAALAYDQRHDKLFFASMHTGSLAWIDLKEQSETPLFYTIDQLLVNNDNYQDEALNITRMAMGADGNGYAITNDGSQVVRFTTGNKIKISNLGGLIDAASNNGVSIQNKCTSWGGDIVGDVSGKLFLFSAAQNVFEIDLSNMVATYKGRIQNLPAIFSLNGAAVDENDQVMVSSANSFEGFYKINMDDLTATKLNTHGQVFNASDLASSYLLGHTKQKTGTAILSPREIIGNKFISVYPNPVNTGTIKIGFEKMDPGKYQIALTDLQGRLIESKTANILYKGQIENFTLKTKPVKGIYMIKITDSGNQNIYSDKLVVE